MTSAAPGYPGAVGTAASSQYHHFIPRLILRGFAQNSSRKTKGQVYKKVNKDGLLRYIRTEDGTLSDNLLSRHYGLQDMYRDRHAADQQELEKKLAHLETDAGRLITRAKQTFLQAGATMTLKRPEKDTLRKFLFLMKYRNSQFHSRFNVETIDDYVADDKAEMKRYMRLHGFRSPRAVWFANMHTFLDLEMDAKRGWHGAVQLRAYPDDALLFILHMEQSYMAFCRPQSTSDEFVLTENCFGIFEGPNSLRMNPATGELQRGVYTEWHNFAPLSASLLIILRSNFLPGNIGGTSVDPGKVYKILLSMHPSPERAVSILQDLPVKRCTASQPGKLAFDRGYQGPSSSDEYVFECFDLEPRHVNLINSIFLEEAISAKTIAFKSDVAMKCAIQTYLEDPRPGFKVAHELHSARHEYLRSLENALQALGRKASTVSNTVHLPIMERHPLDYAGHMARWVAFSLAFEMHDRQPRLMENFRLLGGSSTKSQDGMRRWLKDVEQAGKILFMHIKVDSALSTIAMHRTSKSQCKLKRRIFFASLHPRFIWLYVKALRNLDKFHLNDFTKQSQPLECQGPEDDVVRDINQFRRKERSAALLEAADLL